LLREIHAMGVSMSFLPYLVQQTGSNYLKKLLLTEIVSVIFCSIFRSEMNNLYATFPFQSGEDLGLEFTNR